jgi:very-short-patch-repair endonuclease
MKKPKSAAWYAAMNARKGKGTNQYTKAKELGLPKPVVSEESHKKRSLSSKRPHSEETKKKISAQRIKFLRENPDKVPYKLNHYSKGRSYAEEYWKVILDTHNLSYDEQYQIGPYQLDFAFPKIKIDLEIDGDQHYLDKRVIESDQRRNKYLEELGWTVIRVKWSEYKKLEDKKSFVNKILSLVDP